MDADWYFWFQFSSVTQSCPTLCNPMDYSTPDLSVHHQLPAFTQTHVHWIVDAIQPPHSLSSPSPPAFNLSQHQALFQWLSSSHQVAKVLEFQLPMNIQDWFPWCVCPAVGLLGHMAVPNWCFWTMVLEKTLESSLDCKEIKPVNPKGYQSWIFTGRTGAEAETPIFWPPYLKNWLIWEDPECWERLKVGGEGADRGWDGWMASLAWWTWVWGSSRSWWGTGKPGVLQSMGSQRVGHNWVTELNWEQCWERTKLGGLWLSFFFSFYFLVTLHSM